MGRLIKLSVLTCLVCISLCVKGQDDSDFVYSDSSISKIHVTEIVTDYKADNKPYKYLKYAINTTNYSIEYLNINKPYAPYPYTPYIAEKTITAIGPPGDADFKNIRIKLTPTNNKQQSFIVAYDCADIQLNHDFYNVIIGGCCGIQDEFIYYNYISNHKICAGEGGIMSYEIPNHNFKCYVGYTVYGYISKDSNSPNTLYIGYNTGETYKVIIKDNVREECSVCKISFITNSSNDRISDSYSESSMLWSLNGIKSINEINNLKIVISLSMSERGNKNIEIPIINGKPFGKDSPEQTIEMPK